MTIYITILQLGQGSHTLAFIDSTSAQGWMHKVSFDPMNAESHNAVARWNGWTIVSNEKSLYSQHIKGTKNIIADYLSRDFHRSDQTLTKIFNQIYHNRQRHFPHQTAAQERYLMDIIASGSLDASNGIDKDTATKQSGNWDRWGTLLKHSGITDKFLGGIPQEQKTILVSSFAASVRRNQFGKPGNKYSSTELSSPPYWMYLRPSGRTFGATQP